MHRLLFLGTLLLSASVWAETVETVAAKLAARASDTLDAAQALVRAEPRNGQAMRLLARAQMQNRDFAAAVKTAERAARLDGRDAAIQLTLGEAYSSNVNNVGMLSKMSYAGRIRDAFTKAVELDPDNLDARSALLQFHMQAPGIAGGSMAKAYEQADEIGRRHPARGMLARGQLLEAEGNRDQAIDLLRSAVATDASLRGAHYQLGYALQRAERWDEAHAAFFGLIEAHPDEHGAWYQIGRNAALSGLRLEEGQEAFTRYIERAGEDPGFAMQHVQFRLGNIHEKAGRVDQAGEAYRAALEIDPDFEEARKALQALR